MKIENAHDLDKAIEIDPSLTSAYLNRAYVYQNLGDMDRALIDYNTVIELDETVAAAYSGRARLYELLEDIDQALLDYGRAI